MLAIDLLMFFFPQGCKHEVLHQKLCWTKVTTGLMNVIPVDEDATV